MARGGLQRRRKKYKIFTPRTRPVIFKQDSIF